ncbi:Probable outer membrane protein pmp20 (Polymorphic membrane protein 20), partial [Durusdinium trenchii]
TLRVLRASATDSGGGFYGAAALRLQLDSTVFMENMSADWGAGFYAEGDVNVSENSSIFLRNATATTVGGGFMAIGAVTLAASRVELRGTTAVSGGAGGLYVQGLMQVINGSTISIRHARTAGLGGGVFASSDMVIAGMSNLSMSNVSALQGGGFHVMGRLQVINSSTLSIQNARAGNSGGGFFAQQDVNITGMSKVKISDSQAVSGHGGGFEAATGLQLTEGSAIFIENATAGRKGGAAFSEGNVVINSSNVSIQYANAGRKGGGFHFRGLTIYRGFMSISNSTADLSSGGLVEDRALLTSQSQLVVRHIEGSDSFAVLTAGCLHILSRSTFLMENVKGSHAVELQNSGCKCSDITLQVERGAALDTTGHCPLSLGLLSVQACDREEKVHLFGIHLQSWSGRLLTLRSSVKTKHVVIDDVSIHYQPPLNTTLISTPEADVKVDSLVATCPDCPQGITLNTTNHMLQALSPTDRQCPSKVTVSNGTTSPCDCPTHQITKEDFLGNDSVALKDLFATCRFCDPHSYYDNGTCRKCGGLRAWSDGKSDKCNFWPLEKRELACLLTGGAIMVFLAFVLFEILISPLVVVDATSDPLEIAGEKVFTITTQGPIVGLPTYLSRIVHWLVSYRVEGTSLQWLDFDKKSNNTVKVRSIGHGKLQLQDVYVPFHCAACKGVMHATKIFPLFAVLTAFISVVVLDTILGGFERIPEGYQMQTTIGPLTCDKQVSFVTLWGGRQVDYFVSHSWGTSFSHFVRSIRSHAMSKGGQTWTDAAYWICSFANNQWNIEAELGTDPMDSAFACALTGGIKGVVMVLDQQVQPLTRVWCLFEFFLSSREHLELDFGTDAGVIGDDGCTSFDIALEVGRRIKSLQVVNCETSSEKDKQDIFDYIVSELGSLERMDEQIRSLIGNMLKKNLSNVGHATETLLLELGQI